MNPFIKNCRTGYHDDILNRTSHYLKLLNTKSSIINKQENNYLSILRQNNSQEQKQSRIHNNQKLMNSLIEIQHKYSTYRVQSERYFSRKRPTMKSGYEQRQKELSLSKDNLRLYKKIVGVESDISTDKIKRFDQDATRYAKLIKHPVKEVAEMDERLFETFRHEMIRTKLSPAKHRLMTDEFIEKPDLEGRIRQKKRNRRKLKKLFVLHEKRPHLTNPQSIPESSDST